MRWKHAKIETCTNWGQKMGKMGKKMGKMGKKTGQDGQKDWQKDGQKDGHKIFACLTFSLRWAMHMPCILPNFCHACKISGPSPNQSYAK